MTTFALHLSSKESSNFKKCLRIGFRSAIDKLKQCLDFKLTEAQEAALADILKDLSSPYPMMRLLQGDVGTGKTAVAALAAFGVVDRGYQCAVFLPRRTLEIQFHQDLQHIYKELDASRRPHCVRWNAANARTVVDQIGNGSIDIVVGTPSMRAPLAGKWKDLGLVIVDEEHKLGLEDKNKFHGVARDERTGKAASTPHYLAMTATPIPRSLALASFGVMTMSTMEGLPPGGKGVTTRALCSNEENREIAFTAAEEALRCSHKVYVVCSTVRRENEDEGRVAVQSEVQKPHSFAALSLPPASANAFVFHMFSWFLPD